jgi:mevalonate pyrophosphate decarboxylase
MDHPSLKPDKSILLKSAFLRRVKYRTTQKLGRVINLHAPTAVGSAASAATAASATLASLRALGMVQ